MEKRRYGRTAHMSTLAVFGAAVLSGLDQNLADQTIQKMIDAGVNHIDVAPSYGHAEDRLGPWMPRIRKDFFLGCKTTERTRDGAVGEFQESLERLQTDNFDLYQLHAVNTMEELDMCTSPGGALEGVNEMREQGLTRFIGITGHGMDAPKIFIEALRRYNFDSVLFPIYPALFADHDYRRQALTLLDICEVKDVGVMTIKSAAKEPWGDREHTYHTWYVPFDEQEAIQQSVDFVLSQKLTHICTAGDYRIMEMVLKACNDFSPMDSASQEALIRKRSKLTLIF
jgi:predicted aldo/keto reductase-like oxidoreductase